jgi:hypothetical protein
LGFKPFAGGLVSLSQSTTGERDSVTSSHTGFRLDRDPVRLLRGLRLTILNAGRVIR